MPLKRKTGWNGEWFRYHRTSLKIEWFSNHAGSCLTCTGLSVTCEPAHTATLVTSLIVNTCGVWATVVSSIRKTLVHIYNDKICACMSLDLYMQSKPLSFKEYKDFLSECLIFVQGRLMLLSYLYSSVRYLWTHPYRYIGNFLECSHM